MCVPSTLIQYLWLLLLLFVWVKLLFACDVMWKLCIQLWFLSNQSNSLVASAKYVVQIKILMTFLCINKNSKIIFFKFSHFHTHFGVLIFLVMLTTFEYAEDDIKVFFRLFIQMEPKKVQLNKIEFNLNNPNEKPFRLWTFECKDHHLSHAWNEWECVCVFPFENWQTWWS